MKKEINHIHMLGICGTGMGSLAGLLKVRGYHVTGTDQAVYPPMSTQLEKLGIKLNEGFDPKNLVPRPDLLIVGNVIRKDNSEVVAATEQKIPYLSMPAALSQLFLDEKDSIVVTGTHGKTTTANIIAWLLEHAGLKPSFMIGGVGINFGTSFRYGSGKYFVVEGDEYDTAFFDKGPKFLHYKPKYAVISSIEFDHADIYKDLDHIKNSFTKFVEIIPADGFCVINSDDKEILSILNNAKCRLISYGFSDGADYKINITKTDANGTTFILKSGKSELEFTSPLSGKHNTMNTAASLVLLLKLGVNPEVLREALLSFKGVKRRQEIRGVVNHITILDDFAHHPTAIRETISGIKSRYTQGKLWAIFEPRSNTTRRNIFEHDLAPAFSKADKVILARVFKSENIPENERLNPERVVKEINKLGVNAFYIPETKEIVDFVSKNALPGDVVLIMSNGAFDNIHEKMLEELKK